MKLAKKIVSTVILTNCSLISFGATSFKQVIVTTVPSAVNISAYNQSLSKGNISPQTGISSSPSASFNIKTNGEDCNYTYSVQAKLSTADNGDVNAYVKKGNKEYLILGNISSGNFPSLQSVNDIKNNNPTFENNANAIAYPIKNILNNIESASIRNNPNYNGIHYAIKMGNSQNGNFVQSIDSNPLINTYSITNDRAGTYQAIITFTANRNP